MNDHERFKKHLMNSQKCVWKASKSLSDIGLPVTIEPTFYSDSYDNRLYYQDNGDIRISLRIEVKGINTNFKCQEDFPYSHMFVCAKHSWDFTNPKPFGYIIYNKEQTHFAFIPGSTHSSWSVNTIKDKRYDNMVQKVYKVSLDKVLWNEYPQTIKGEI